MTVAYDVLRELRCATVREVAARLGVKYNTARVYLKRLVDKGLAEKRGVGRHILYCVAKDADVVPRGAYKLYTATRKRLPQVLELLERYGCISVSALMQTLGVTHTQAYYLARLAGVKMRIGNTAILCRDRAAAEELVERLRETVHRVATANGMKYATPAKILRAALRDRSAYALLNRFIPLRRDVERFPPAALAFIDDILQSLYGEPMRLRRRTVYIVSQPRRDYTINITDSAETHVVPVKLPDDLAAAVEGVNNLDEVVLQAIEQLLQRFRT